MSTKDRLERKKYMRVCRWESELMARMMSKFPNTVIRYMERKRPNMKCCNLIPLRLPEEEIVKLLLGFLLPCVDGDYRKIGK